MDNEEEFGLLNIKKHKSFKMNKIEKNYYLDCLKHAQKPIEHEHYRIVWVDSKIYNKEN